jgi:putative tryptophan/tyrosine transport system substrate-binding protein
MAARAQQGERARRIGQLMGGAGNDLVNASTLREELAKLGWVEGRNLRIDLRFGEGDPVQNRAYAAELVKLAPEVIVASSGVASLAVQEQTSTIPIVMVAVGPNAGGVQNIARPEGNMTGFPTLFYSIGGKWVELLKEAAPHLARIALVFNAETPEFQRWVPAIETPAATLGIETFRMPVRSITELDQALQSILRPTKWRPDLCAERLEQCARQSPIDAATGCRA